MCSSFTATRRTSSRPLSSSFSSYSRRYSILSKFGGSERGISSHSLLAAYVRHLLTTLHCLVSANINVPTVEFVGYIGRAQSHSDQWELGPYIIQSLLLLVAPALFAASIYIILGRIILMTDGELHSTIRLRWLTKVFVTGDVISFLLQGGGGGIQSSGTESAMKTGEKLIIAGLFVQLAFFGVFVVIAGLFHTRLQRYGPASISVDLSALPWKRHLLALYASSALILVRSVFRVIEYLMGNAGYLLRHEVFLYVFDAVLMLAVMVVFNFVHPSEATEIYQQRMMVHRKAQPEDAQGVKMQLRNGREVPGGPWS
jgi:hypothetical protein